MKAIKFLTLGLLAAAAMTGFTACQDDIDTPDLVGEVPVATLTPNSTILEVKEKFWKDTTPYCDTIGTKENGEHYIIKGRVISSDYSGNIYKSIYIQDETAALPFSVNQYNLYLTLRVGQEVVVDLTGMYIGRYGGLEQMGYPQWSASSNAYQPTFMQPALFSSHYQLNGLPEPAKVDTILVSSIADLASHATDAAYLQKMQGQLVRINNVAFNQTEDGVLGSYHENVNTYITDTSGTQTLTIRTSGYSTFWNNAIPTERGDVVGILGYYLSTSDTSSSWQITLIDANGLMNFGNPTMPEGDKANPYSVTKAVSLEAAGTSASGWVEGYIVGTVAPEVETITSSNDIEWGADATLATSVVIGQTANSRSLNECLVIALPQNSVMREYVALANHPENLGKKLTVKGTLAKYMGTYGITGNRGTGNEFLLEGVDVPTTPEGGSGTEADPYTCSKIIELNPTSTTTAVASGVWAYGYIVGYYYNYEAHFTADEASNANILLADSPNETDKTKCISIQLPYGTVRDALNLASNPGLLGYQVAVYGDVMKYNTLPGIKNTTNYIIY
jgi:hypothetical protein